jgi:hypothetical protein
MKVLEFVAAYFGVPLFSVLGIIVAIIVLSPVIVIALFVLGGILKVIGWLFNKFGVYTFGLPILFFWIITIGYLIIEPYISSNGADCRTGEIKGVTINGEKLYFDTTQSDYNSDAIKETEGYVRLFCHPKEAVEQGFKRGD